MHFNQLVYNILCFSSDKINYTRIQFCEIIFTQEITSFLKLKHFYISRIKEMKISLRKHKEYVELTFYNLISFWIVGYLIELEHISLQAVW